MDFLKKQLDTIQTNLAGLNATQKMLAGALVVIMAMTMVYWSHYAGTAEMEPVLNQTLTDQDVTRMSAALDSRGIPYKVEAGKLLVSADKKFQAIAAIGYDQLLPSNTVSGFEQMYTKSSPFDPPDQQEALRNHAREITLAQVIGGFPNVASAVVMIDSTNVRRIGEASITPTATVNVMMRGGALADSKFANAAADLVCGAVAGMNRSKIKVIIDGRTHSIRGDNDGGDYGTPGDQLEAIQNYERSIAAKIENQLQYMNGVVATVTGTLNTQTEESKSTTNDEKNTLVLPKSTDEHNIDTSTNQGGSNEPGAVSNIGGSVTTAGGGNTNTSTETQSKTENEILPSSTFTTTKRPAGNYTAESASVRIPRAYFVGLLKRHNGGKDPSESEILSYVKDQLTEIRTEIRGCTNIKKDDNIFVGTFEESMPDGPTTSAAGGVTSSASGIQGMLDGWGKEVGVGALAVISLFMVSTMVKRSTPAPLVIAAAESKEPTTFAGGEDVAGFATDGGQTLAGMELDADTIQTQQVVDQVTNLVGENPDGAAQLVKRWLNRT